MTPFCNLFMERPSYLNYKLAYHLSPAGLLDTTDYTTPIKLHNTNITSPFLFNRPIFSWFSHISLGKLTALLEQDIFLQKCTVSKHCKENTNKSKHLIHLTFLYSQNTRHCLQSTEITYIQQQTAYKVEDQETEDDLHHDSAAVH